MLHRLIEVLLEGEGGKRQDSLQSNLRVKPHAPSHTHTEAPGPGLHWDKRHARNVTKNVHQKLAAAIKENKGEVTVG